MPTIVENGHGPSFRSVGRKVVLLRIVRSVLSVSATNESSPVALGILLTLWYRVQAGSLIMDAAHGIVLRRALTVSSMML